jgi:spore maturation protein CgeB
MTKPTVIYYRPENWKRCKSEKLNLIHVPITGENPILRSGRIAGDGVGEVVSEFNANLLIKKFHEYKPDFFFYWALYGSFTPSLCAKLRKISPKTVFIFGQGNQVLHRGLVDEWLLGYRDFCDVVLTNTYEHSRHALLLKYGAKKTGVLYDGFDPAMFDHPLEKPKFDCFFGGGCSMNREKTVQRFPNTKARYEFLKAVGVRFRLHIKGGNWITPIDKTFDNPLVTIGNGVNGRDYVKAMQTGKIILNVYHFDFDRYYTKRTVYAMASGRIYLTRYIPHIDDVLKFEEDLVWFRTFDEGINLIDYYLKNDEVRESVAAKIKANAYQKQSWEARLREFEAIVETL